MSECVSVCYVVEAAGLEELVPFARLLVVLHARARGTVSRIPFGGGHTTIPAHRHGRTAKRIYDSQAHARTHTK